MNEDNIQRGQNRENSYKVRRNVLIRLHVEEVYINPNWIAPKMISVTQLRAPTFLGRMKGRNKKLRRQGEV